MEGSGAAAGRGDWRLSRQYLSAFVFGTGAAVMAVEFSAERLLAPFFGSSEMVWGMLIGLILLALSAGYWIGGRLADRRPEVSLLGLIVLLTGIFVGVLPTLSEPLLAAVVRGLLATPATVVVATLAGTALLFVPPVLALGMVSPFTVRLALSRPERTGSDVGALYASSTLGSLFGTFIPVFFTIPSLGVRSTLWLSAGLLILFGGSALYRAKRVWMAAAVLPLASMVTAPRLLKPVPGLVTEIETPYQFADVYRLGGQQMALSVNDGAGIQSLYTPKRLTGMYYDAFLTLPFLLPQKAPSALLIGMGGGTIPVLYQRDVVPYRPVKMVGVEIDPALVHLGETYFHLSPRDLHIVFSDGRVYLETTHRRYNLLMVDAYSNEIYIPFDLTTTEFFALCRQHLTPHGLLALNVNATSSHAALLTAMERTLEKVFPYVSIARAPGAYNYLLVAGTSPITAPGRASLPPFLEPVARGLQASWHRPEPGPGLVLTDNRAPVESLVNAMIAQQLLHSLRGGSAGS